MGSGASSPQRGGPDGPTSAGVAIRVIFEGIEVDVGLVPQDLTVGGLKQLVHKKCKGKPYPQERMLVWLDGFMLEDDRRTLYGCGCEEGATLDITDAETNAHQEGYGGSFSSVGSGALLESITETNFSGSPVTMEREIHGLSPSVGANGLGDGSEQQGHSGRSAGNSGRSAGNSGRSTGNSGRSTGNSGRSTRSEGKRRLSASAKRERNVRIHVEVDADVVNDGSIAKNELTLHIDQESTIARLKSALAEQTGIPVGKQVLLLAFKHSAQDVELDDDKRTVFGSSISDGARLTLTTTRQRRLQLKQQEATGKPGFWDFLSITQSAPELSDRSRERSPKPAVDSDQEELGEKDVNDDMAGSGGGGAEQDLIRVYATIEGKQGEIQVKVSHDLLIGDLKAGLAQTARVQLQSMELLLLNVSGPGGEHMLLNDDRRTCFGCFISEGAQLLIRDRRAQKSKAPAVADTFENAVKQKQAISPATSKAQSLVSVGKAAGRIGAADTFENARATASPTTGITTIGTTAAVDMSASGGDYWARMDTMHDGSGRAFVEGEDEFQVQVEVNGNTVAVTVTPDMLLEELRELLAERTGIKARNQSLGIPGESADQVELMTDERRSLYGYFLEQGTKLILKGKVTKKPRSPSPSASSSGKTISAAYASKISGATGRKMFNSY